MCMVNCQQWFRIIDLKSSHYIYYYHYILLNNPIMFIIFTRLSIIAIYMHMYTYMCVYISIVFI